MILSIADLVRWQAYQYHCVYVYTSGLSQSVVSGIFTKGKPVLFCSFPTCVYAARSKGSCYAFHTQHTTLHRWCPGKWFIYKSLTLKHNPIICLWQWDKNPIFLLLQSFCLVSVVFFLMARVWKKFTIDNGQHSWKTLYLTSRTRILVAWKYSNT